ncbi:MAG: ammonium transporter [Acidobacteriia bacterium]|nr:ammonium transporter [Terriglobia bacterium]
MAPSPASLPEVSALVCFLLILLVPFAGVGLALTNCGLGRARSAAHAMLAALAVTAVAAIVYVIIGFAWQGVAGRPEHILIIGGKAWGWIAAEPFFLRGLRLDLSPAALVVLLQIFSVGLAGLIPLSSGSDRWRLGAICASTALLAGFTYPLFAHWVWGGGWLAQLGANCGLGRGFVDGGGSGTLQAVGGLTALSITWILGARRGKFSDEGLPAAIPGHSAVLVLLGCLFAWVGWIGLNSGGALLFLGVEASRVVLIAVNTTLCAAASGLTAVVVTRVRFGRPDASLSANGWVAGLVASSAGAAFMKPAAALIVGGVAGIVVPLVADVLEFQLAVDDPGGAISVHAVGGLWGLLAVALLTDAGMPGGSGGQWLAQLVGMATLLGFVLPLSYGLNWLLDRVYRQRVEREGEFQGMDLYELGAGAYPEFDVHGDEFLPR